MDNMDMLYDEAMEQAVLGSVLINQSVFVPVSALLSGDDFFLLRHQYIWEAMDALMKDGQDITRPFLRRKLKDAGHYDTVGGDPYLSELIAATPTSMYGEEYAHLIKRDSLRRAVVRLGEEAQAKARDRSLSASDVVEQTMSNLIRLGDGGDRPTRHTLKDGVGEEIDRLERLTQGETSFGLPTTYKRLDKLLSGFHKTDLIVLAGRPGMGKTSFALNMTVRTAQQTGARIGIFSMEMGLDQLTQRMASAEAEIPMSQIRTGEVADDDPRLRRYMEALARLSKLPIYVEDGAHLTADKLELKARQLKWQYGVDMIVVDYVQLMSADNSTGNRTQDVAVISRRAKELARELKIPVLLLAQLNRKCEERSDKRPQLSDLKDSGALEQDADVVMFLYRDIVYNEATEYPNQAEVIVAKHRNGPTDTVPLYFDATCTRFLDGITRNVDLSTM